MAIDYDKLIKVELTQGYYAIIDKEDLLSIKDLIWSASFDKKRRPIYAAAKLNGEQVLMHRFILGLIKGDGKEVDHINGDPLDNRKGNLRICTHAQNQANSKSRVETVLYKGVAKTKSGMYQAHIALGTYKTAERAAKVYDRAIRQLHGEFARPNFLTEREKEKFELVDRDKITNAIEKTERYTSKYRGISWRGDLQKWAAYIQFNKKHKNLGSFNDEKTAALIYDYAVIRLNAPKEWLNFPWLHDIGFQTKIL